MFDDSGMSKSHQKQVYLTQVNSPRKSKTRNLVLGIAGQQFRVNAMIGDVQVGRLGDASGVTGQKEAYSSGFDKTQGSLRKDISPEGLISQIMKTGYFSLEDTFVGLIFDARFNYEFRKKAKDRNEEGYYKFIMKKLGNDVGTIYLAGHSRGGCLAMRLASRLNARFPKARIVVHNFDAVCTKPSIITSSEFGVTASPIRYNPLNRKYFVYMTNLKERFVNRDCLSVRAFLSGEQPVNIGILNSIFRRFRAFGHLGFVSSEKTEDYLWNNKGITWYTESMHNDTHGRIDNNYHDLAVQHFVASMKLLPCACGTKLE